MLHVHPKPQHRCRAVTLRPLFTGEQQQEGIWLLHWQGSLRRQPCKRRGGASSSASPVSLGTAFFIFLIFFQLCLHQRLHWFTQGNPGPVAHTAIRGVQSA